MSSCTVSSPSSFSAFLNKSVFSPCVIARSHTSLQKRLLASASGINLSLFVSSSSINNLLWFGSNDQFYLYCSSLLSYLSNFATTANNLCRTSSGNTSLPFLFTLNFLSSFDMTSSFRNFLCLILFNCLNSLRNTFCFSKKFLC